MHKEQQETVPDNVPVVRLGPTSLVSFYRFEVSPGKYAHKPSLLL